MVEENKKADSPEVLEFDLNEDRIPVKLKTKEGKVLDCYLKEMDGMDRDKYLQAQRAKTDGKNAIKDFKDLHALLIGYCLFDKQTDAVVPKEEIRVFPAKVQNALFEKCVALNALGPKEEETLKNE